jgi:hypothetical protein
MGYLKYLFIGAILYACTKKPSTPVTPQIKGGTGGTGGSTGGNGSTGGTGGGGGVSQNFLFEFNQPTNGNQLPTNNEPYGNGYIQFQFAPWSIISKEANSTNAQLQTWIEFKLYDSANNVICNLFDRRANYHPNYIPFFPSGTELRSNNHLPEFRKYLRYGNYRLQIKNISPNNVTQNLRLGTQGTGGDIYALLHEDLAQGETKILDFVVSEQTDGRSYVFNCNVY